MVLEMDRRIRSRYNRCGCGRVGVDINGTPLCEPCHKLQKLQSVDLLSRPAPFLGLLPKSYFDVLEQLKREYRCMGCRSVNFAETVTCETCMEHEYCSFACLQAHKMKHTPACVYTLIAKRTSAWSQRVPRQSLLRILVQAKTLNDTGCVDFEGLHCNDWLHVSFGSQGDLKQARLGISTQNPAKLACTFPSFSNKERYPEKSPGAKQFMKRNEKIKRVSLETKKQNEIIVVDSVVETVGNNLMKETEQTKYSPDTFQDLKRVISNGMFARCLCDNGVRFGEGWWKCLSTSKPRKQALKIQPKPFVSALQGVPQPAFGLGFYDFYGDSDSEEVQQEAQDVRGWSNSTENSTELSYTTSSISQILSKQQTQDTTNPLSPVSETSQQTQTLPGNKTTTGKQRRINNTQQIATMLDFCFFCHHFSDNLKTCARCGFGKYCSKSCQVNGFAKHKTLCKHMREMNVALSMIPSIVTEMLESKYGSAEISFLCDIMLKCPWYPHPLHVLVKIIDVIPRQGFYEITVQDSISKPEKLFLQPTLPYSMFHAPDFGIPLPLTLYLQPGNYILLIDAQRESIFIREFLFCNDDKCFFILKK